MIDFAAELPSTSERRVVLGKIRSAVGLAGAVKVETYTDPPDNILKFKTWQLQTPNGWRALKVKSSRWTAQGLQVQFEGVVERNAAELLRNTEVAVYRHELPAPAQGEYYRDDLLGLTAFTSKGECLGRLDHYVETPAHALMVLLDQQGHGSQVQHLVPLVKGIVLNVDFDQRTMVLDWSLDWMDQSDNSADVG